MAIRLANAPVNFGIYEPGRAPIGPERLLAELAAAGYEGVDSGPLGYLGVGAELTTRLADAGLRLAGGWVDLRYDDPDGFAEDLAVLDATLDMLASQRGEGITRAHGLGDEDLAPRPTLACPPYGPRFARPGAPGLPAAAWPGFAARVRRAADRCRERGLEPVFHQHLGTLVETRAEVERLLELTDVSVCLDTGHLWLAGGDPVSALRAWGGRVRQVHVKDASRTALEGSRDLTAAVAAGCFPALGAGQIDLAAFVTALGEVGYHGWVVVEQDAPATGQDLSRILADQRTNHDWLRHRGL